MIKGVHHSIIEINETGNPYFERALLFVKPDYRERTEKELALYGKAFAGRVSVHQAVKERRAIRWYKRCVLVLCGAVFGAIVGLLLPMFG